MGYWPLGRILWKRWLSIQLQRHMPNLALLKTVVDGSGARLALGCHPLQVKQPREKGVP